MEIKSRKSPEGLERSVIYQLFLRAFTLDGTLKAAERLLPHLADLKFDIIYLCPIVEADDDLNKEYWSERQLAAGYENPKNSYRMKDYFKIDEEYGTDDDLKDFVNTAHSLGLKVMLDLVYLHCGPNAVFIKDHPDFVKRDENNNIISGIWKFPLLNYKSNELREYLWSNMAYFIQKFGVDGYRCDVGDKCPLDFWEESRKRLEKINSNIIMLNEGVNPESVACAFDINYNFEWSKILLQVMKNELPAKTIKEKWTEFFEAYPIGGKYIRTIDTHDIAHDSYENRIEKSIGSDAVEAALIINHTLDGIPFIYNGYEVADDYKHNMFSNRFYGRDIAINWSNALTEKGEKRLNFIKTINSMRHKQHALAFGDVSWLNNNHEDSVVSFFRHSKEQNIAVIVNTSDNELSVEVDININAAKPILNKQSQYSFSEKGLKIDMLPYSYLVIEV